MKVDKSDDEKKDEQRVKVLDIITCSGYGRDGCLAVINGGVVPDVIHHTALPKRSM
jgi:3-dehydroquinate synthetase